MSFVDKGARHQNVAICLCTCIRPRMLQDCLASLMEIAVPEDCHVQLVVVDNDMGRSALPVVQRFKNAPPYPIIYVNEPVRGIARARNAALYEAIELQADWIVFLDDDQTVERDWLVHLMAPEYRDIAVLSGAVNYIYPDRLPFWAEAKQPDRTVEGTELVRCGTGNVRFTARLLQRGLRFDENIGFMGGEDTKFFRSARAHGFCIKYTRRAVAHERMPRNRLTYWGQFYRKYWYEIAAAREVKELGLPMDRLFLSTSIPYHLIYATLALLSTPVAFCRDGRAGFRKYLLAANHRTATAFGRAAVLLRISARPYAIIDGN